jgi:hypothetical protein
MTTIAGKPTQVGTELWHQGLGLWAQVSAPGVVTINGINGQKISHGFTTGGFINGRRMLYWHQPLVLDSQSRDITKYQALIDAAYTQFGDQ